MRAIDSPDRLLCLINAYCTSRKYGPFLHQDVMSDASLCTAQTILFTSVSVSTPTWWYKNPYIKTRVSPSVSPSRFCFLILILTRSLVQIPHTLSYTPTLFKFFILKRCCPSPKSSLSPPWPSARLPRPSRSSNATPASTPATRASPHAAIVAAGLCRRSSLVWRQTSTSSWMQSV